MKKYLVMAAVVFYASVTAASAQSTGPDYSTGVGVKFGWWNGAGISVKHFMNSNAALEGILSLWHYGGEICGLYEYHGDIAGAQGLKWYVGAGAHVGIYNNNYGEVYPARSTGVYLGPDGVLGLDYKITGAPIDLSLDIQPRIDIPGLYFYVWGGLGVRFAF